MDIRDIYGDVNIEGIRIETSITSPDKPLCVFGILETARGLFIEERMMEWLTPCYNVIRVYQKPSGELFEYPALRLAQYLCTQSQNAPYCLYLHTKGAANWQTLQAAVISNWKTEFTSNKKNYISQMMTDKPVVCCPFTGLEKQTWFNGFFANKAAWADLDIIKPNEDRYTFENLWRDYPNTKVYGIMENRVEGVIARWNQQPHPKKDKKNSVNNLQKHKISYIYSKRAQVYGFQEVLHRIYYYVPRICRDYAI